jgi:hypothetical protein
MLQKYPKNTNLVPDADICLFIENRIVFRYWTILSVSGSIKRGLP